MSIPKKIIHVNPRSLQRISRIVIFSACLIILISSLTLIGFIFQIEILNSISSEDKFRLIITAVLFVMIFSILSGFIIFQLHHSKTKLQVALDKLTIANKELETFSYSVSHDLRSPLRAIDGFSKILEEQHASELSEKSLRLFSFIRQSTKEMSLLIDALLHLSHIERADLKKMPIETKVLVEDILKEVTNNTNHKVNIVLRELHNCQADQTLLKQVFSNLLSNAVKYTKNVHHPEVEIGSITQNLMSIYYVKDNGVGFDMRYVHKLFNLFQRLHSSEDYEGTGVGLALVKKIIQRHEGDIWVESEPGKGTTFYFTIRGGSHDKAA